MGVNMNWIRQKLELQIIIIKPAQLGVLFDSSGATAAHAAMVEHESDRP
jgi:hypothetical protein